MNLFKANKNKAANQSTIHSFANEYIKQASKGGLNDASNLDAINQDAEREVKAKYSSRIQEAEEKLANARANEEEAKANLSMEQIKKEIAGEHEPERKKKEIEHKKQIKFLEYEKLKITLLYNRCINFLTAKGIDLETYLNPIRSLLANTLVYILVGLGFVSGESPLTYAIIIDTLPLPIHMVYMLTVMIAGLFFLSAHYFTKGIEEGNKFIAYTALAFGLAALTTQIVLRVKSEGQHQALLSLLNIGIYLMSIVVAYWHNKDKTLYGISKILDKCTKDSFKIDATIENNDLDLELINTEFDEKVNKGAKKEHKKKLSIYETAKAATRASMQQKSKVQNEQDTVAEQVKSAVNQSWHTANSNNLDSKKKANMRTAMLIAACATLSLTACTETPTTHDIILGYDKSISESALAKQDPKKVAHYLVEKELQLHKEEHLYDGVRITLACIGNSPRPQGYTLELPAGATNTLSRIPKQRKALVDSFIKEVYYAIDSFMTKIPADQGATYWSAAQCSFLNQLSRSDASHRSIFLFGDGFETGTVNFNQYKTRTAFLDDFESITNELNNNCSMGDLQGIKVTLVSSPLNPSPVITTQDIAKFWQYYLDNHHHAQFTVTSTLY